MNLKRFEKRTKYTAEKTAKRDNFERLNTTVCKTGQTVLAGDSITEICNTELYGEYSAESGLAVYNRGISGDTSNRLLERWDINITNLKPKKLVILIGTNDLNAGADAYYISDNIEKMLIKTAEQCPDCKIILQAVYPVSRWQSNHTKRKNSKISELNSLLCSLAKKHCALYIDLTDRLSDENGYLDKRYTYDGLHPNIYGFETATEQIIKLLKK